MASCTEGAGRCYLHFGLECLPRMGDSKSAWHLNFVYVTTFVGRVGVVIVIEG